MSFRRAAYALGMAVRESGQALHRAGCRMQGDYRFEEQLNRHRVVMNLVDAAPQLSHPTYIAPTAHVAGNVSIAAGVSVWPGAVIRGDLSAVAIGARSAIRERAVVAVVRHGVPSRTGGGGGDAVDVAGAATVIGADVSVGCGATVHAATLKDGAVIGAGAVVGRGAVVGERAVVGAGSVVAPGTVVPPGTLFAGSPAVRVRAVTGEELSAASESIAEVGRLSQEHASAGLPPDVAAALGVPVSSTRAAAIA